jgi:hypothetical protein
MPYHDFSGFLHSSINNSVTQPADHFVSGHTEIREEVEGEMGGEK